MVKSLLDVGADVNATDSERLMALSCAAFRRHSEIVKCLLDAGANTKAVDFQGLVALHRVPNRGERVMDIF